MTVYIYSLHDPRDGLCRYVGKTLNPKHRMCCHIKERANRHKCNWVQSLSDIGLKPVMEILEVIENSDDLDWQLREIYWINEMRRRGFSLTNLDGGGHAGRRLSEETKAKLAEINRGKQASPETRLKMSMKRKGIKFSKEHAAKIGEANRGRPCSEYTKRRMREGRIAKPITKQERINMAIVLQKRRDRGDVSLSMTEDKRRKISASLLGRKMDEGARRIMSEAQKKRWDNRRKSGDTGFKITDKQAMEVFNSAESQSAIASRYGITQSLVSMIKSKKSRKYIHQVDIAA